MVMLGLGLSVLVVFREPLMLWRGRRLSEEAKQTLRRLDADALATQVRDIIRLEGWESVSIAARLLHRTDHWTDEQLVSELDALYAELAEEDRAHGRRGGPGSNVFECYDRGLVTMIEVLRERVKS